VFIATLIAVERLSGGDISAAADALRSAGAEPGAATWIEPDRACDLAFTGAGSSGALDGLLRRTDVVVQPVVARRRPLLVADMDSTMITVECIDELADYAGLREEVSQVTERAMRGEIEFGEALRQRVALLTGLEESAIDRCCEERVRLMPGARALVRTMRRHGAHSVLVSGGFARFADPVGAEIGFDRVVANRLATERGRLTGAVIPPIVDSQGKRAALLDAAERLGISPAQALAVGDGANDVPMIEAAGLGVAYRAKPAAAAAADARIVHNDLTALLYAQGWPSSQWEPD
jgi:phosphoserine phosphatase